MKFSDLRIVAMGGGTGLPAVLRSLKDRLYPSPSDAMCERSRERLTAIVTVTDDGGSSGRLRRDFNILPPGDIRNCLSALSEDGALSFDLFQYRFEKGNGLQGHSLGNLLLTALTHLKGNFLEAVQCCSDILNVKGRILPCTSEDVSLGALFTDGLVIRGETHIAGHRGRIKNVFLVPSNPVPLPQTIRAIENADAIIVGPGSLYTSIIPNLLAEGMTDAIKRSKAKKIFICNQMTEPGETDGYSAADHIRAIYDHTEYGLFESVLLHKGRISRRLLDIYRKEGSYPVRHDIGELRQLGLTSVVTDLVSGDSSRIRHDEEKLGKLLFELMSAGSA
jgi:uncharacterized cofD-like protein